MTANILWCRDAQRNDWNKYVLKNSTLLSRQCANLLADMSSKLISDTFDDSLTKKISIWNSYFDIFNFVKQFCAHFEITVRRGLRTVDVTFTKSKLHENCRSDSLRWSFLAWPTLLKIYCCNRCIIRSSETRSTRHWRDKRYDTAWNFDEISKRRQSKFFQAEILWNSRAGEKGEAEVEKLRVQFSASLEEKRYRIKE